MSTSSLAASQILESLASVDEQRQLRANDAVLKIGVDRLKHYQQRRFENTYADLLRSQRYSKSARFFLDELYGPGDFVRRDRQFARIVPKLVSMFPAEAVETVGRLAALHAVTERLDTAMAEVLRDLPPDRETYIRAWQRVGCRAEREFQVQTVLSIGRSIDHFTGHPWVSRSLRWMRAPAKIAGLGDLQAFLEKGMACFTALGGAGDFLSIIERRETELLQALYSNSVLTGDAAASSPTLAALPVGEQDDS